MSMSNRLFICIVTAILFWGISQGSVCAINSDQSSRTLDELWQVQIKSLRDSRISSLTNESSREDIREYLLDNGIGRSPILAAAYSAEGISLLSQRKIHKAVWAFESSLLMDPTFIPGARGLLYASLRKGISSFIMAVPSVIGSMVSAYRDPWVMFYTLGNFSLVLIFTLLIGVVAVTATLLIRYFALINYEITEHVGGFIPAKFISVITIVLLGAPILAGFGLCWAVLFWIILLFIYLKRGERLLIWSVVLPLLLIIPANILRVSALKSYEEPYIQAFSYARDGGYSQVAGKVLKEYLTREEGSENVERAYFLMGLLNKRGGHYFDALKDYMEFTRLESREAGGHVNLGNVYFILNNLGEAIAKYRRAENLDNKNAAIYYNLSKAYLHQFKFDQATNTLNKASNIDSALVTYYTEIHTSSPNRMLVDSEVPRSWVMTDFKRLWDWSLANQSDYWIVLGPGLTLEGTVFVLAGLIVLLLLLHVTSGYFKLSKYCISCSKPMRSVSPKGSGSDKFCSSCQMLFMKKGQVKKQDRGTLMREIKSQTATRGVIRIILSLVVPGTGEIYHGRFGRGLFLMYIWILSLVYWFTADHRMLPMSMNPPIGAFLGLIGFISILLVVYLLSLYWSIRGQQQ